MWCCSSTAFSGQYQTPKRRTFGQKASGFRLNDKEKIEESLELLDEMLEGTEREKEKGSVHALRKFPYSMGHEQYNLLKKMVKILTQES